MSHSPEGVGEHFVPKVELVQIDGGPALRGQVLGDGVVPVSESAGRVEVSSFVADTSHTVKAMETSVGETPPARATPY